ncbi:unnamed protein product [Prorocentrum cordatum]|uniref:Ribosome biogenesis protein NOP53 n=1 Tax=Prorocentrum cordatum TaxID=2364126 RepID=A0ABN9XCU9_9DINO|nr:unnamed protein product [Polarella glacialis]
MAAGEQSEQKRAADAIADLMRDAKVLRFGGGSAAPEAAPPDAAKLLKAMAEQSQAQVEQSQQMMELMQIQHQQHMAHMQSNFIDMIKQVVPQVASTPPPPSPAAAGAPAAMAPAEGFLMKLPLPLMKNLEKLTHDHEEKAKKLIKARHLHSKTEEDVKALVDGHYPNGIRAFRSPIHQVELDSIWDRCATGAYQFDLLGTAWTVPKQATRREAKRIAHMAHAHALRSIDAETLQGSIQLAMEPASKQKFMIECQGLVDKVFAMRATELGLDGPMVKRIDPNAIKEKFETLYAQAVEKVATAEQKRKEYEEKAKEKAAKQEEKLLKVAPETLFQDAVSHIASTIVDKKFSNLDQQALGAMAVDASAPKETTTGDQTDAASKFVALMAQPKNGAAPPAGQPEPQPEGQRRPPKCKDKKGKTKDKSKGESSEDKAKPKARAARTRAKTRAIPATTRRSPDSGTGSQRGNVAVGTDQTRKRQRKGQRLERQRAWRKSETLAVKDARDRGAHLRSFLQLFSGSNVGLQIQMLQY